MRSGDVATTDGGGAARARVSERSAGHPPVASAKVSGLGLGLRARLATASPRRIIHGFAKFPCLGAVCGKTGQSIRTAREAARNHPDSIGLHPGKLYESEPPVDEYGRRGRGTLALSRGADVGFRAVYRNEGHRGGPKSWKIKIATARPRRLH